MDIIFLKSPTEATLEVTDVEYVRQLASQRMASNKRLVNSANPAAVLMNNTPSSTPVIQPVIFPTSGDQQVSLRRARRGDDII